MKTVKKDYFEEIGAWPRSRSMALAYVIGFVLSLLLTMVAYALVSQNVLPYGTLIGAVIAAAILQLIVQAYCFLHLGVDRSSHERLFVFAWAGMIIFILVAGSLWIMFSLNGRMVPNQQQMVQYMNDQDGF